MMNSYLRILGFVLFLSFGVTSGIAQAQQMYTAPRLSHADSWSLVLVPDPQSYVKFERNQGVLDLMTGWISEYIDSLNIGMVLCTGDLVEHNDWLNPNGTQGNQPGKQQ